MIKSFLSTLLFLFTLFIGANAQERVNRDKINFKETSNKITEATGFSYNNTLGEWIDYKNLINSDKAFKTKYKLLGGSYLKSKSKQNFNSLQFKKINVDSSLYYCLIIEGLTGSYKYPNIKRDWQIHKITTAFIINEDSFNLLSKKDTSANIKIEGYEVRNYANIYNKEEFTALIVKEIKNPKEINNLVMQLNYSNSEVVRFRLPESSYYIDNSLFSADFSTNYFEITREEFNKLLIFK